MSAARSVTPYALALLEGPRRVGRGLGHGYVEVGEDVLALTLPGRPRLPNGIECDLRVDAGERISVGGGALRTATATVTRGPLWDPRPRRRVHVRITPYPQLQAELLLGWGPGLTPLGDDIVVGQLARGVMAPRSYASTTRLSRTLLRRAELGELPEPAHALLADGDPEPLLRFGATSGRGILLGLAEPGAASPCGFRLELPLPTGPASFEVSLC